jgi:hypothetical protein
MTVIRVVDYVASPGGGCRFTAQMLRALRRVTSARFEIVTYAHGVRTYAALLGGEFAVRAVAPVNALRAYPPWTSLPGGRILNRVLHLPEFHFDVPASVFEGDHALRITAGFARWCGGRGSSQTPTSSSSATWRLGSTRDGRGGAMRS